MTTTTPITTMLEAGTLVDAFERTAARVPDRPALAPLGGTPITWREYAQRVRRLTAGLAELGVGRGDVVALMLTNRPEFHFLDAAAMRRGAITFSIYATSAPEQVRYVLSHSLARVVAVEQRFLPALRAALAELDEAPQLIVVDGAGDELDLERLAALSTRADAPEPVETDDVLTLIYTSGTTGPPKAVQLTHRNLLATCRAVDAVLPLPDGARVVSYLPAAHIAERFNSHYLPMFTASTVTTVGDPARVFDAVAAVHPTAFFGVPRIWEKLKAAIEARLNAGAVTALKQGDRAHFAPLRQVLGLDALRYAHVAAAPTPPEVIEFFHAIGVPLSELWGMSETCAVSTLNPPDDIRIGTVGRPLPGVEVKLADDGEIVVRGETVMAGYRNDQQRTADTFDAEGWLLTGDIGELDEDGYLRIVDRKKELIINAGGKNMSPANIESRLKVAGPLIGHAVAIGDRRPYNVALLTLEPEALPALRRELDVPSDTPVADLIDDPRVTQRIQAEVDDANLGLSRIEQIKRFALIADDWQPGGEELTPTLKLKRKAISARYAPAIDALYGTGS